MPAASPPNARRSADALVCGLVAFVAYLLLGQRTLYSVDAHGFLLEAMRDGVGLHAHHFSYRPLLVLCREVGQAFGVPLHTVGVWLSALGVAVGVAFAQAANARVAATRAQALWATACMATAPAVVFFATVLEVHGQHLGFCGAAFLATANFAVAPGVRAGIWLGGATGLGYLGHATGALLPAVMLPMALALAGERGHAARACWTGLATAAAGHVLFVFAAPWLLGLTGLPADSGPAGAMLGMHLAGLAADPLAVADAAWRDWSLPFAPMSFVATLALAVRRTRWIALALALGAVVYVVVTAALLVPFVGDQRQVGHHTEYGAYLLPLAWPAGLVAVRLVGKNGLAAALAALGAAIAVAGVWTHDTRPQRAFAEGLRELQGERPTFTLVGGHDEIAGMLVELPERRPEVAWQVPVVMVRQLPAGRSAEAFAAYDLWLRQRVAGGAELWLTAGCIETLEAPGWTEGKAAAAALLRGLRDRFAWTEHRAQGCVAYRLAPR